MKPVIEDVKINRKKIRIIRCLSPSLHDGPEIVILLDDREKYSFLNNALVAQTIANILYSQLPADVSNLAISELTRLKSRNVIDPIRTWGYYETKT